MATPSKSDTALGTVLREERERQDISQESLAHAAGMTVGALGRVERSQTDPAWSTVTAIARALKLSLQELGRRIDAI